MIEENRETNEQLRVFNKSIEECINFLNDLDKECHHKQIMQVKDELIQQSQMNTLLIQQLIEVQQQKLDTEEELNRHIKLNQELFLENGQQGHELYELGKLNNEIKEKLNFYVKCKQNFSDLEAKLNEFSLKIQELKNTNNQLTKENKRLNENNQKLIAIIDQNELKLIGNKDIEQQTQLDLEKAQNIINQLNSKIAQLESNNEIQVNKIYELESKIELINQQSVMMSRISMTNYSIDQIYEEESQDEAIHQKENGITLISETNEEWVQDTQDNCEKIIKDYCGILNNKKIKNLISQDLLHLNKSQMHLFTDTVFRINLKGIKIKKMMIISELNFYFIEENFKLTRQFPISSIKQIFCSDVQSIQYIKFNQIICSIQLTNSDDDYLIETFKRQEMIDFLNVVLDFKITIEYNNNFLVNFKNYKPKQITELANGLYDGSGKQAVFKGSALQGFLQLQQKKLFGEYWQELFAILIDAGLLLFKQVKDLTPSHFVPTADAVIIKNPLNIRGYSFKIKYKDSEFVFKVNSEDSLEEWYNALNRQIVTQHKYQLSKQRS